MFPSLISPVRSRNGVWAQRCCSSGESGTIVNVNKLGVVPRRRHHQILAILIGLWLGLSPVISAGPIWEHEHNCCCGGEGACLLGGCDCDKPGARETSPCGGLKAAKDTSGLAVTLLFARDLGMCTGGAVGPVVEDAGPSSCSDFDRVELAAPAPEPPPPRSASAC